MEKGENITFGWERRKCLSNKLSQLKKSSGCLKWTGLMKEMNYKKSQLLFAHMLLHHVELDSYGHV